MWNPGIEGQLYILLLISLPSNIIFNNLNRVTSLKTYLLFKKLLTKGQTLWHVRLYLAGPILAFLFSRAGGWASLIAQLVKNLPAMQETPVQFLGLFWFRVICPKVGLLPGVGRSPGGGHVGCLENPHRQRSLAGYSPWGQRVRHDSATKHSTAHKTYIHL